MPPASAAPWTRAQWLEYADRLLAGARRWASPDHARITPPGAEGGYGRAVDGLEGFARTFLLAGFRIAGERGIGKGIDELIDFYTRGLRAGVDLASPERWVRLDEHPQAKVEAASIALILDMTRPWIWDCLDDAIQQRLVDYLSPVVGDTSYPPTNWLWFRVVVQTFLRSVGGPWSAKDISDDLALHDSLRRADGWLSDGPGRSFDHYVGWALHLYPVLWSRMRGADEIAAELGQQRTARDVADLDRYLADALCLVGGDGSPLIQGRSLIYRFAAAAPFWAGVLAEVPSHSMGQLRHAAERIVRHFADRGIPAEGGALTMGWHDEWRRLAQSYSGPGSPYWAVKGLIGISLPADHPVWAAPIEPLPIEQGDVLRVIKAPGWIVSGTRADGIVRVINHGNDHAAPGSHGGDSPLYARLGYSTAAVPLHDGTAWREPLDQSVTLVDSAGRATHRAGMELHDISMYDGYAAATSQARVHWIDSAATQTRHGSGIEGAVTGAGRITVQSLVRGAWEVRLVRVDELEAGIDADGLVLRVGGWPLAGADVVPRDGDTEAGVTVGDLTSRLIFAALPGDTQARSHTVIRRDASPLGAVAATPVLDLPTAVGRWQAVLVSLSGDAADADTAPHVAFVDAASAVEPASEPLPPAVIVAWPDGAVTQSRLAPPRSAHPAAT